MADEKLPPVRDVIDPNYRGVDAFNPYPRGIKEKKRPRLPRERNGQARLDVSEEHWGIDA